MKILIVNNYYQFFGGIDRVAKNEQDLLRAKGEDVMLFEKHNDSIKEYGFADKAAFFPNVVNHRAHLGELRRLVEAERPDVAHLHNIYPLLSPEIYPVLKSLKVPVVQSMHDHRLPMLCPQGDSFRDGKACDLCHSGNFISAVRHRCLKSSLPISAAYAFAVARNRYQGLFRKNVTLAVYFNEYMKKKLQSIGFPEEKMAHKPHFLKDDIGVPTYRQGDYAVFMGALSPHKGILTLIEAFRKANLPLGLKIIGDGAHKNEVAEYLRANGMDNVEMLGFQGGNERFTILKNARFSVVPSEVWETFCLSALESLACGVPVIGSKMGSIPYLVSSGETGLLFDAGNAGELAEKIAWMFQHPGECMAMGRRGRRVFEANYTADANYDRMLEIYHKAIEMVKRGED